MEITWYGTATIKIQSKKQTILIDPFVPMAPSTVPVTINDFYGVKDILVTHGHFDHIQNIPELCQNRDVNVYATQTPINTLQAMGVSRGQLHLIANNETFSLGDIRVRVFHSRHVKLDAGVMLNRDRRRRLYLYPKELMFCLTQNMLKRENKEIVGYELINEGRSVFVLGSLGMDGQVDYPQNMDMLILPYQGTRRTFELSREIIERLQPKAILLDHFDDTFPPVTFQENTEEIKQYYAGKIPVFEIEYKKPISI